MLTLLSRTDAATAEIPPQYVPSFTDLERLTGYSRSTLIEWMKALTEAHWVVRFDIEGSARQGMRLASGDPDAARPKRSRATKKVDGPYRLAVRPSGVAIPPGDTDRTAERYSNVPPGGTVHDAHCLIKNSPTESSNPTNLDCAADADADSSDGTLGVDFGEPVAPMQRTAQKSARKPASKSAPKAAGEETHGQRVNRIARLYTDKVKLVDFHGVRQAVDAAFKSGDYSEQQITAAIQALTEKRDPVTRTSLRIAIEGQPSWADRNANGRRGGNQHKPYHDPADIGAYKRSKI